MFKAMLHLVVWMAFVAVLLMWPAGTLAFPGAWAFIVLFVGGGGAMTLWLAKASPSLLRERMGSPVQRDQKPWDRIWLPLFILVFCGWLAVMGYDAGRTGFAAVPLWLQALGGVGVAAYLFGAWCTFRANAFAAPVVKIQRGQRVIDTGPYARVRHPMYASTLALFAGLPLLLGSWWGLAGAPVFVAALAWRAVNEERALRAELDGYDAYAARVRYRFVPQVW